MSTAGRSQGGIIGVDNPTSFGKNKVTSTTSTGTFTTQPGTTLAQIAVVAGGGGGGGGACYAAGAGAGGMIVSPSVIVSGSTGYAVVVGGGGAGGTSNPSPGARGCVSSFAACTPIAISTTGGGGGAGNGVPNTFCRTPGGSGGGGASDTNYPCSPTNYGSGICGQGYPGNTGYPGNFGGAGGGKSAQGGIQPPSSPTTGGAGGAGLDVSPCFACTPNSGVYAGGGGHGSYVSSAGGAGGAGGGGAGGAGGNNPGVAGDTNTGGGGGGAGDAPGCGTTKPGGAGGSGIVLTKELDYASGVFPQTSQYNKSVEGSWPQPPSLPGFSTINLLVIAGGGGGGGLQSGGAGAGGYRFCATHSISPGNTYKITIGAGGAAAPAPPGPCATGGPGSSSGINSSFDTCAVGCTYSATGGGVGVYGANPSPVNTPLTAMGGVAGRSGPGGSGGGRGESNYPDAGVMTGNKGGYPTPEGNNGGNNWSPSAQYSGTGGGGGGAGAVGSNPTGTTTSGPGGAGSNAWPGDSTLRAGGGGGSNGSAAYSAGAAGPGGGGKGGNVYPAPEAYGGQGSNSNGTANTGGGAGGGGYSCVPAPLNRSGGSGVVIIQYPDSFAGITGGTIAPVPGCKTQHTFTATGCFVIPF